MDCELNQYLKDVNFDKQYKKLIKKLKGKKIIIYGSGQLFQLVNEKYDLSELNIIGISDMKFSVDEEGGDYLGYKIIPKEKMVDYNVDYVLVATLNYIGLVENFVYNVFNKTKTRVSPLVKKPFWTVLKEIWC